ncbi:MULTISPECIES: arabinose ABC transporter substrate-binding protein [Caballeronia]|uniref:L-arabinose-binding periplasmic protein n=1 Tax=Caballeronia cordobensis TaxID=1353886 RepID=A0A158G2X0_CABCO|nr:MULTISPECIES: substrate-binding domain-containing protein [Caballeronia]AET93916.1 L-arabinose ABC transporter, periplasmic L-arabinose-binding protein [Burkholderia sp. YI23]AQH04163.1 sugar ABC transporter substrate-binding protein [Burkholderia sp. KK1]BAO91732.1 L-arabinose ABC transporter, periplasmic L-arabinose-binding protein [Burkholderia sp. RPE67]BBQ02231.1 L-arabinose-binding periplasmic protein [Burkholderia sp. SFA1]MCE4547126.1 arabinose ABC transporter substrate-binding prot
MTSTFRRLTLRAMMAAMIAGPFAMHGAAQADEPLKIGFLVKMPEQAWFINEQKASTALGQKENFTSVNIGTPDGEKVLAAIDNLGAQGAQGFVICAPDVRLGPAIQARAKRYNMKFVSVDDQLVDTSGKPLSNVPHLGMSAFKIGNQVGDAIAGEMKRRGWKPEEVGALRITDYELPTAKLRTDGATQALIAGGFKKENIFDAPQKTTDDEGGFNAASPVLAQHPNIKKWVIFALNEESVLGGVRATEQLHIASADVIGVGINGAGEAFAEFQKKEQTGFFGTIAVSSTNHGKDSAQNLVEWIRKGKQPPADTQTTGKLMTRENWKSVRTELGI